MPRLQLSRKSIAGIPTPTKATIYYDASLTGFGIRVTPTGKSRWIVEFRAGARSKKTDKSRLVIGDARIVTIEEARDKARGILAAAQLGGNPAKDRAEERKAITVKDVLDKYLSLHIATKRKPRTLELFTLLSNNYICPTLGNKQATTLTRQEIARWHREAGERGNVMANRALLVLSAAITFGQRFGYMPEEGKNPAKGIERFRESARERYLSAEELARLGETLRLAESEGLPWKPDLSKKAKHVPKTNQRTIIDPFAIAAIRLLLFTGARRGEILNLEWTHVDLERGLLNLPDSKTGKKVIPLGGAAVALLKDLPRIGDGKRVIAGRDAAKSRVDLKKPWSRITTHAGLEGLRLHDLRHSFAAIGASSGLGLPLIGKLLGHREVSTTARYAHLADTPMKRAADAISGSIASALNGVQK